MDQPTNNPSCRVRRADQQITPSPVQAAEDIVSAAWIRELTAAVDDANATVRACLRLRKRALTLSREALKSADPSRISKAQIAMEAAVRDLADGIATRNGVKDLLARERTDRPWSEWLRLNEMR